MKATSWRALPPVGEPIHLRRRPTAPGVAAAPRHAIYLESGTASLALLFAALVRRAVANGSHAREVLVPAHGCPDVVSAVVHAGLRAKLVDLAPDSPFPSAENWRAAIDHDTLALLTVGFLGIRDPFGAAAAYESGLPDDAYVEDACQVHPRAALDGGLHNLALSFGRGKPVSLMHGGAALASPALREWLPGVSGTSGEWAGYAKLAMAARLYNVLRSPWAYGWVSRLPGLGVGETHFHALDGIRPMNSRALECLDVSAGWDDPRRRRLQRLLDSAMAGFSPRVLRAAPWRNASSEAGWLLRYPLLFAHRGMRDAAARALDAAGLGASRMYGQALPAFAGVQPHLASASRSEQAAMFADCLLTLPLHADVRDEDVDKVVGIIRGLETA